MCVPNFMLLSQKAQFISISAALLPGLWDVLVTCYCDFPDLWDGVTRFIGCVGDVSM